MFDRDVHLCCNSLWISRLPSFATPGKRHKVPLIMFNHLNLVWIKKFPHFCTYISLHLQHREKDIKYFALCSPIILCEWEYFSPLLYLHSTTFLTPGKIHKVLRIVFSHNLVWLKFCISPHLFPYIRICISPYLNLDLILCEWKLFSQLLLQTPSKICLDERSH